MNLSDLNKELFQQVIMLGKSEGEQLKEEIAKSQAIANVARAIIDNNRSYTEAMKVVAEYGTTPELPAFYQNTTAALTHEK